MSARTFALLRKGVATLAAGSVAAGVLAFTRNTSDPEPSQLNDVARAALAATVDGACDVTGVHVSYETAYADDPHRYFVDRVTVDEISTPSCNAATLTVALRGEDGAVLAEASGPVAGTVTTLDLVENPDARLVYDVDVELEGGYTPWPTECNGFAFQNVQVGSLDGDEMVGVNPRSDLLYGLAGNDRLESMQGDDCLDAGADDDTIVSGNGNSVLFGGDGDDTITAGNGNNKIFPGGGTNTVVVGSGKNVIDASQGANTITMGNAGKTKVNGATSDDACWTVSGNKPPKPVACA